MWENFYERNINMLVQHSQYVINCIKKMFCNQNLKQTLFNYITVSTITKEILQNLPQKWNLPTDKSQDYTNWNKQVFWLRSDVTLSGSHGLDNRSRASLSIPLYNAKYFRNACNARIYNYFVASTLDFLSYSHHIIWSTVLTFGPVQPSATSNF